MRAIRLSQALLLTALLIVLVGPGAASAQQAPGAVLIWPVNPVIEAERQAGALWLENRGKTPVTLQIRIYDWAQADGRNLYAEQQEVVGTPPIVSIAPGEKQLVRLTRMGSPPEAYERPFRLIVDEIPIESGETRSPGAAVAFRMRYSLPLFVRGRAAIAKGGKAPAPEPVLGWHIIGAGSERMIEVGNEGVIHARLTEAALGGVPLAGGLLGYVLPGRAMRWPIPASPTIDTLFTASINGAPAAPVAPQPD